MARDILAINDFAKNGLALSETRVLPIFSSIRHEPGLHSPNDSSRWPKSPSDAEADARGVERRLRPTNWSPIELGTGTTNLSHTHPVLVAAQAAMLNHLLKGRLLLYAGKDWEDRSLGIRSIELMAEKVMPEINAAIGCPEAAEQGSRGCRIGS